MNPTNLIKMANRIGAFFDAMPDREQAVRDVASHILRSWEPRMIDALRRHATAGELAPIVGAAMPLLASGPA